MLKLLAASSRDAQFFSYHVAGFSHENFILTFWVLSNIKYTIFYMMHKFVSHVIFLVTKCGVGARTGAKLLDLFLTIISSKLRILMDHSQILKEHYLE